MGRKNNRRRNNSQTFSRGPNNKNARSYDPRFEQEESHFEYGQRVKGQRYPQPVKNVYLTKQIVPKNLSQELYLTALKDTGLVIGSGSAGSGKTYLAIASALNKLVNNEIEKIVITRPVVEAGESLGFLPGTFEQKVLPYLQPLLEAVEQIVGVAAAEKLVETGKIVFAPLAFMRGSTYRNAIVILDESQNTTVTQMKLFLTRPGEGTSLIITGDPTQSDLKDRGYKELTGLEWAIKKLGGGRSKHITVVEFSNADAIRSPLMSEILYLIDAPDYPVTKPQPPTLRHSFGSDQPSLLRRSK